MLRVKANKTVAQSENCMAFATVPLLLLCTVLRTYVIRTTHFSIPACSRSSLGDASLRAASLGSLVVHCMTHEMTSNTT